MHFLLSNDDGYQSAGIAALALAIAELGELTVVAPDRNRSGASNSLTLDAPLYAKTADNDFLYVNGTPTDCVHLAITGLLAQQPDMVISGINAGANLGDDVLYSGTVAAAMEGRFLGYPAVAVSLVGEALQHYAAAAQVVVNIVTGLLSRPLCQDLMLNINIPDLPYEELGQIEITRLGHRHMAEPAIKMRDPKGQTVYWVGPPGAEDDAGPGTDFHALANGNISVTPLQVDLTRYSVMADMKRWMSELKPDAE